MKTLTSTLTLLSTLAFLFSCNYFKEETNQIQSQELQNIIDSSNVSGSILIFNLQTNTYYSNDFEWANAGHLPASTFKVPNSIIALETGVVENDSTIFKWDGEQRRLPIWDQDLTFREAFHYSCVPCYQEIARKVGVSRMKEFISRFDYGKMIIDTNSIDVFWLEGDSKVTQFEQIDFLKKFYLNELNLSERTNGIMRRLMIIETNEKYTLSGKTGWSIRNDNNNGWFVGYLEKEDEVYFFAVNIIPNQEFNMKMFAMIRKEIAMKAFEFIGIIGN
jgi:beta-lactamase class D